MIRKTFLWLVLLFIGPACAAWAQQAPASVSSLILEDGTEVVFAPDGTWSVKKGNDFVAAGCGAAIWVGDDYRTQVGAEPVERVATEETDAAFRGRMSAGAIAVDFTQTVRHLNGGLMVRYEFAGAQLTLARSVAVVLNLPLARFAGMAFVADGTLGGNFPDEPASEPRLVAQPVRRLVVADGDRVHLLVEGGRPEVMVLQDSRTWGIESYQLLVVPEETPARRAVTFFLAFGPVQHGPRLTLLKQSDRRVGLYEPLELTLDFWGRYSNPFDPDDVEVTCRFDSPTGRPRTIAGFVYQGFERREELGQEYLTAVGGRLWKVRFTPDETGVWSYLVTVRTREGISPGEQGFFAAEPSKNPGFLRVSQRDRRFFEFASGQPFFGVGHNVCWAGSRERTLAYDLYFNRMRQAGQNFTRIWFCSWDMTLEGRTLDDYRLDNAWRMDYVLELARRYGIYVKLCLDNFYDYRDPEAVGRNPYFKTNGGPIETPKEFFSDPQAKKHYQRRLRYIVSRWAHLPNVLAWEQWNEVDYACGDRNVAVAWSAEMARHLKSIDPYGHMVTTTLGPDDVWYDLWQLPEMDFVQVHTYIHTDSAQPEERDEVDLMRQRSAAVARFGKPFLVSEFGYLGDGKSNPLNDKDTLGIALHNAIWASAFSGAAATVSNWWWDTYIHPNDLYYHYAALARFVSDLDWTAGNWHVLKEDPGSPIRTSGLASSMQAYVWVQQKGNNWYSRIAEGKPPQMLRNVTLRLSALTDGLYRVEWWNTTTGARITYGDYTVRQNELVVKVPEVGPDVACKVHRLRP